MVLLIPQHSVPAQVQEQLGLNFVLHEPHCLQLLMSLHSYRPMVLLIPQYSVPVQPQQQGHLKLNFVLLEQTQVLTLEHAELLPIVYLFLV